MENSVSHSGYVPGLEQPGITITLRIPHVTGVDFDRMDKRLMALFGLEEIPPKKVRCKGRKQDLELAWRVLVVASHLAQAVNIPIFDQGNVLSIVPRGGQQKSMDYAVLIPAINHIPRAPLARAYDLALRLIITLQGYPNDRARLANLLSEIDRDYVRVFKAVIGGGESTIPVLHAAYVSGIPFSHLGKSFYRLGWGCLGRLVDRSAIETDSALGARVSQDKYLSARVLREAGLPAPEHVLATSETQLSQRADKLGWPLVVKPADRDRGEGVSVDINDSEDLIEAFRYAQTFSKRVLVERQASGVCHRIFVANREKVLFVAKRLPKSVVGDGKQTVRELILELNQKELLKAPWLRLKPFPEDEEAVRCLAAAGMTMETVPAQGEYGPLRRIQSDAEGGVTSDMSNKIHPDNVELAIRVAELFNLNSPGIDLISEDVTRPWWESGAIINEVNFAPLLGGRNRSQHTSTTLATFIDLMFPHGGRIPLKVFVGQSKAREEALAFQKTLYEDGVDCFVASHLDVIRPDGSEIPIVASGLFGRVTALLARRDVEYLILLVQTDEFVTTGLPVDRIDKLHLVESTVWRWQELGRSVSPLAMRHLLALLEERVESCRRTP